MRRAINHYIDRKQLIDTAYAGASEAKYDPFPGFGSLKPYIDAIRPIADKHGIGTFDKAKGDELMQKAGYAKNASGIWEKDGKPLTAIIEAIPVLNAVGPDRRSAAQERGHRCELPVDARKPRHHARRQIRPDPLRAPWLDQRSL